MADYDDELSGVLFKNDKRGNEKAPDLTGTAEIQGVKYRVAAWKRSSNNTGKKFFSLKFEDEEERAAKLAEVSEDDDALDL